MSINYASDNGRILNACRQQTQHGPAEFQSFPIFQKDGASLYVYTSRDSCSYYTATNILNVLQVWSLLQAATIETTITIWPTLTAQTIVNTQMFSPGWGLQNSMQCPIILLHSITETFWERNNVELAWVGALELNIKAWFWWLRRCGSSA